MIRINNSNICPADNSIIAYNHFTHVQCLLHTGRTHQIEFIYLQLGYPLAGDDLYGGHLESIQRQCTVRIAQFLPSHNK